MTCRIRELRPWVGDVDETDCVGDMGRAGVGISTRRGGGAGADIVVVGAGGALAGGAGPCGPCTELAPPVGGFELDVAGLDWFANEGDG